VLVARWHDARHVFVLNFFIPVRSACYTRRHQHSSAYSTQQTPWHVLSHAHAHTRTHTYTHTNTHTHTHTHTHKHTHTHSGIQHITHTSKRQSLPPRSLVPPQLSDAPPKTSPNLRAPLLLGASRPKQTAHFCTLYSSNPARHKHKVRSVSLVPCLQVVAAFLM